METTFKLLPDGKIEEQYTAKDYTAKEDSTCICYRVWSNANMLYKYRKLVRLTAKNVRSINAQFVTAGLKMPFVIITNRLIELN